MLREATAVMTGSHSGTLREVAPGDIAPLFPQLDGRSDDVLALAGTSGAIALVREAFDSEIFAREIGRVVAVEAASTAAYAELFSGLAAAARDHGYAQILRRTQAGAFPELWALGSAGFEVMDIGVTFSRRLDGAEPPAAHTDMVVRPASEADVTAIAEGMLHLPWGSRYESDPAYTADQVRDLRTRWLWNSYRGRAAAVLVAEIDGRPAAFATCVLDAHTRTGDVELVGTLPVFRGRGAAAAVVAHAVHWFSAHADLVTVRTQATNQAAANVYERAGFTLRSSDLTFRASLGQTGATS